MKRRGIAILGSTGSIGRQALEVIQTHPELFQVEVLVAFNSTDALIKQAIQFQPNAVVIGNEMHLAKVREALFAHPIKIYGGEKAIEEIVAMESIDMVLTAMVGFSGLRPTLSAIRNGKAIALANKETLVVAGDIVIREAQEFRVPILPVDSEHSAIFQCLSGESGKSIERLILTASGGPFRGHTADMLKQITVADALNHPNWAMGKKITIDSASLMNKGLEVIEAKWLFGMPPEKISVVVHPQSIIHSMVEFEDGSIKAQLGLPDMRLPIQYALAYPNRISNSFPRYTFQPHTLTFEEPDLKTFRNLYLAFEAMKNGGNSPCVLNAANEIAVERFLNGEISFLQIADLNENCLNQLPQNSNPCLEDLMENDFQTREFARKWQPT